MGRLVDKHRTAFWMFLFFAVCLVIATVIAPTEGNKNFKDAASVLTLVGLTAVAIERLIEGAFTVLAGPLGQWWPLREVNKEFRTYETQANAVFTDVLPKVKAAVEEAQKIAVAANEPVDQFAGVVDRLDTESKRLKVRLTDVTTKLSPGSTRLQRVSEVVGSLNTELDSACSIAGSAATIAKKALDEANETGDRALTIISSFDDNPARRVAALVVGASLGMIVAGGVGINLFVATLAADDTLVPGAPGWLLGRAGVLLTGVVIGLGSGPTHEVVKALQSYKDDRKGAEVVQTTPPVTGGSAVMTVRSTH